MQDHSSELEGPRRLFTGLVVVEGGVERDQVSDPVGLEGLNLAFQDFPNRLSLCIQSSVLGFLS